MWGNALAILSAIVFVQFPFVERILMQVAVASYCLPIVAIGLIFGIVFTFTDLSIVFLMTMGGPIGATSVLGFAGFQTGITSGDVSHGAAISLFMLPVLLVVVIFMLRFIRRREI